MVAPLKPTHPVERPVRPPVERYAKGDWDDRGIGKAGPGKGRKRGGFWRFVVGLVMGWGEWAG